MTRYLLRHEQNLFKEKDTSFTVVYNGDDENVSQPKLREVKMNYLVYYNRLNGIIDYKKIDTFLSF